MIDKIWALAQEYERKSHEYSELADMLTKIAQEAEEREDQ